MANFLRSLFGTYKCARPLLFRLDAEVAHEQTLKWLGLARRTGVLSLFEDKSKHRPVELMGLTFPNCLGLAAGLDKQGAMVDALGSLGFGHIEIGTITPRPQPGNEKPRLFRLPEHDAIINRMGFNNPGLEVAIKNLKDRKYPGILGFNIGKNFDTPNENADDDYVKGFRAAYPIGDYIAVNLSSPNTKGLRDLQQEQSFRDLLSTLKQEQAELTKKYEKRVPFVVKIAPDLDETHIEGISKILLDLEMDGVIATNTTISRQAVSDHPLAEKPGGLSGAPLTKSSTEIIAKLHKKLEGKVPIIGVGGIMTGKDAKEKLDAGASLVQIYTGLVYRGPVLIDEILEEVSKSE